MYPSDKERFTDPFFSFAGGYSRGLHSKQDPFSMLDGGGIFSGADNPIQDVGPTMDSPNQTPDFSSNPDPNNDYADHDIYGNPIETDADGNITATVLPDGSVVDGSVTGTVVDGNYVFTPDGNGPGTSSGTPSASGKKTTSTSKSGGIGGILKGIVNTISPPPAPKPPAATTAPNKTLITIAIVLVVVIIIVVIATKAGGKK